MYLNHFNLSEFPFGLTPDTQFYFDLPSHTEAFNTLLIALNNGEGFIKITGEVGAGKTMLCRKLLNELQAPFITAYIPNPHLSEAGLRMAIADEFAIPYSRNMGQSRMLQLLNDFLLSAASRQQKPVLIIDEAQALPIETIEAIRLLTNLETEKQKLLQIVLFGQPELDILLQKKSIRQLRQRISFSYALQSLAHHDVDTYLNHRLAVACKKIPPVFSNPAIHLLHFYSKGVPRLINILAHKSLLSAYGKGLYKIGIKQVQLAAQDTEETRRRLHPLQCRQGFFYSLAFVFCLLAVQWFRL